MPIPFSAEAMSGGPEGDPLGIKAIRKIYRKAIKEIPWVIDYPGTPGVAIAPFLGALKQAPKLGRVGLKAGEKFIRDPNKLFNLFKRFATRGGGGSSSASAFGYAFRKNPRILETLENVREMASEVVRNPAVESNLRSEAAYTGQLLREALEEITGAVNPKFTFLAGVARRRARKEAIAKAAGGGIIQ